MNAGINDLIKFTHKQEKKFNLIYFINYIFIASVQIKYFFIRERYIYYHVTN